MSYCYVTKNVFPASEMTRVRIDGEMRLVSPYVPTHICMDCGTRVLMDDTIAVRNTYDNTILVCQDCYDENYKRCQQCGEYHNHQEEGRVIYDDYYCDRCVEEYFTRCDECGEYVLNDYAWETYNENFICEACRDDYLTCTNCGRAVYYENACYEADDDCEEEPYCPYCYDRVFAGAIHNYGYKPDPVFNKICNEKKTNEFFGIEIEAAGECKHAKGFLSFFSDNQVYLKRDGSVSGFEIVTHPMTRRYFKSKFVPRLAEGMKYLRENGFRGHNKAGIHIHVSSEAVSMQQLEKLMLLLYPEQDSIYKKWLAITQRHDNRMREWSNMKLGDKQNSRKRKKEISSLIKTRLAEKFNVKPNIGGTRYTAINTNNITTIEFRIFNSNMRTERIIKNMQVIFSLLDFTKTDKLPTFHNYMRFVEENKDTYKEYWDFLLEKDIYQPSEKKQQMKEIIKAVRAVDNTVIDYQTAIEKLRELNPNKLEGIDDNDEIEGGLPCVSQF